MKKLLKISSKQKLPISCISPFTLFTPPATRVYSILFSLHKASTSDINLELLSLLILCFSTAQQHQHKLELFRYFCINSFTEARVASFAIFYVAFRPVVCMILIKNIVVVFHACERYKLYIPSPNPIALFISVDINKFIVICCCQSNTILLTHNIFLFIRLFFSTAISPLFFSWHLKHVLKTVYNLKVHVETTMKRNKKQANLKHKFNSSSLKTGEKERKELCKG